MGLIFFIRHWKNIPQSKVSSLELWNFALTTKDTWYLKTNFTWLALFIYLLLVTALARPAWFTENNKFLIILDRSSSMMTLDKKITLFDKGKKRIRELLKNFSDSDHVELILFPKKEHIIGTRQDIEFALGSRSCTHLSSNIASILTNINFTGFDDTFIIADGTENLEHWPGKKLLIGNATTDNVGIIKFNSQQVAPGKWQIFFLLKNFSINKSKVSIVVTNKKNAIWNKKIFIDGRGTFSHSFIVEDTSIDRLFLAIEEKDNFFLDNIVCASKQDFVVVSVPTTHYSLFAPLFSKIPGVKTIEKESLSYVLTSKYNNQQRTIFLNIPPPKTKQKFIQQPSDFYFIAHPLSEWVQPNMSISKANSLQKFSGNALLHTQDGPIIVWNKSFLYIGFDLHNSNWPELPSFAIFWVNYFDFFFPYRNNFHYELTNEFQQEIRHSGSDVYNHISEQESNNIGLSTTIENDYSLSFSSKSLWEMRRFLVYCCCVLLIFLWWKEKK
ncbi:hypothetical protein [Candidatus Uabimicrobium sp. HlEnr_7]|uniref:hypothetical protein n=1 Tax=Candidatus Uabimicrobium helgolandensis TaxID=3095367 RepID=UPI003557ED3E